MMVVRLLIIFSVLISFPVFMMTTLLHPLYANCVSP